MKTLLNNSKTFIKYSLTIMLFALLLGTVFVIGFGFNGSAEFGKVYELTIDCFDETKEEEYIDLAKDVLKDYGYSASETFIEDRSYCETIVVRYKSTSTKNAGLIKNDIVAKLELNENLVTNNPLTNSSEIAPAVKALIAVGVIAVVLFVYAFIRFDWKIALTTTLNYCFATLLPLALLAITRIELSITAIGVVALISTLSTILLFALISKLMAIEKQQEKPKSFAENFLSYINENKFKAIVPASLMLLVFVCLIFTFNKGLVYVGLVGIITLVVSAFMFICYSPAFLVMLNEKPEQKAQKKDKV